MRLEPCDYRVEYGDGRHALFMERDQAELMAPRLHGVIVQLYDLRSDEEKAQAAQYLAEQLSR